MELINKLRQNTIIFAGYGYHEKTIDVTEKIKAGYKTGKREFKAGNDIAGDPFVGRRKSLYVVWIENGTTKSGAVEEGDGRGIVLPGNLLIAD